MNNLDSLNNITHESITEPGKMKITINNIIYELDEKDYNENMFSGNTNMVLINGIIYMVNDADYKILTEVETLIKMKSDADATNGKNLNEL